MARARKDLGKRGETAALAYLHDLGYTLLEKNHRLRMGEIDLILRDREVLVFCEVKTSQLGFAWESYTARQRKRMCTLILSYLARSGWEGPVRVDLMALDREPASPHYRVEHFQDILSINDIWL
jgi:putative endonuclease